MDRITLQQLMLFLRLAEHPKLSEAAEALYISQPALSKSLAVLERRLGRTLFKRTNRGLVMTEAGERLYRELNGPVRAVEQSLRKFARSGVEAKRSLRIGYPSSYDYNEDFDCIRASVRRYREAYPQVDVSEYLFEFVPLRQALLHGEIDLIIGQKVLSSQLKGTRSRDIALFHLYIAMAHDHPLASDEAQRHELQPEDLREETFLEVFCYEPAAGERAHLEQAWGFAPRTEYVPNFQTLTRALSQGRGISLCGHFAEAATENALVFRPFPDKPPLSPSAITAIWREGDISPEAERLLELFPGMEGA